MARTQLDRALGRLAGLADHLDTVGHAAATALVADHQAVRAATKSGGRGVTAKFLPPPDVLGAYVFLPETSAR